MIRYFLYIDEQTINRFYHQLDSGFDTKKLKTTKEKYFGGEIKVAIKNIICGFLDGEGKIFNEFRRGSSEEIEQSIKIEEKIMRLINIAIGTENENIELDQFGNHKTLVCGRVYVMESILFLQCASNIYNTKIDNYQAFLSLLETNGDMVWDELKKKILLLINNDNVYGNGLDLMDIMENWFDDKQKMFSFVVIDNN